MGCSLDCTGSKSASAIQHECRSCTANMDVELIVFCIPKVALRTVLDISCVTTIKHECRSLHCVVVRNNLTKCRSQTSDNMDS